jgi:hypothetical protein
MTSEQDRKTTPVSLGKIDVFGAEAYNKDYIQNILSPLLSTSVKTVGELAADGKKVISQLNYLGGFESVELSFDVDNSSKDTKYNLLNEPLINVIGKVTAKPLKPTSIGIRSTHTDLGNALAFKYFNNNVFGHGENFQIDSYLNLIDNTKTVDLLSSTPVFNTAIRFFGHLNILKTSEKLYQSKNQAATSAEVGISKQKYCNHSGALSTVSTGLNLVNRNISHIADSANDEVKTYAGDSVKESIFLNFTSSNMKYLTKSRLSLPLDGFTVSFTNEVAGFPSLLEKFQSQSAETEILSDRQDQFYKFGFGFDYAKSFLENDLTLSTNFKFGSIINFQSSTGGTVNFQDKFYPIISGYYEPIMPSRSVGSGSFLSYNINIDTKAGLISASQPLRFYTSVNGASASNELNGLEIGELGQLTKDWKHGLDVGLLYSSGDATAKVFWKKPILTGSSNDIGKFGFEVDIIGQW